MNTHRNPKYEHAEEKLRQISSAVSEVTKVPVEKILGRRGNVKVSDARNLICFLGVKKKLGQENIARFLDNRNRSTISQNSKVFSGHIETDVKLRIMLAKVEVKVEDLGNA